MVFTSKEPKLSQPDEISWRLANPLDSAKLFAWRNDPVSIKFSKSARPVSYKEHQDWFNLVLKEGLTHIFIGAHGSTIIGMVRFDQLNVNTLTYNVSINLEPRLRGQGLGGRLLESAIKYFSAQRHVIEFTAEVHVDNLPSEKIFLLAGFSCISRTNSFRKFSLIGHSL